LKLISPFNFVGRDENWAATEYLKDYR
jgi:hypothetical protein